jgi:hypothetical protein
MLKESEKTKNLDEVHGAPKGNGDKNVEANVR